MRNPPWYRQYIIRANIAVTGWTIKTQAFRLRQMWPLWDKTIRAAELASLQDTITKQVAYGHVLNMDRKRLTTKEYQVLMMRGKVKPDK
jgi:hypothetical protein